MTSPSVWLPIHSSHLRVSRATNWNLLFSFSAVGETAVRTDTNTSTVFDRRDTKRE